MSSQPAQRSFRQWQVRILIATWLSYFGYYFCRKAFYIVKGDKTNPLGFSGESFAWIGVAYLVGYAIGQFCSAFFGRKLGPKLLLLFGMGISIACNVVFGSQNSMATFSLFMAINGLAQGTGWPGCIGSLGYWFRRQQRGSILGLWSTCYQLGSMAASAFAAFMLGTLGWRWSFFGASLILLIVWAIVLWLHPDTPEKVGHKSVDDDDDDQEDQSPSTPVPSNGLGWTRQVIVTIILMGCIYFCIKFLRYALWSWAPYFLSYNFGLEGDDAGYLSIVFDFFGFAGVLLAGWLSDKWLKGRRAVLSLIMLSLMALSFVAMYVCGSSSVLGFAISMGFCGFMLYGPDSLLSGVGAIDVGSQKGALVAAGIINGMGSIGAVVQEFLIGWRSEQIKHNLEPVFYMFVVVGAISAGIMFILWLRSKKGKSNL
jgi:OPA family glycerol-3-phosphate transporter-like MFS transporter